MPQLVTVSNGQVSDASQLNQLVALSSGRQIYDVKNGFGAVGDGVADDTAEIQAAINAAGGNVVGGGGIVFFPAGAYKISSTLTIPGSGGPPNPIGITLLGVGAGDVNLGANLEVAATRIISTMTGNVPALYGPGNTLQVMLQNIAFIGPGVASGVADATSLSVGASGAFFAFVANVTIMGCNFIGYTSGLVIDEVNIANLYNVGCILNRSVGLYLSGGSNSIQVLGGAYSNQAPAPANTDVGNAIVSNIYMGPGPSASTGPANVWISVPFIDEPASIGAKAGGSCIRIDAAKNVTITGCGQIAAGGPVASGGNPFYGIFVGALARRVNITDCRIEPFAGDRVPTNTIFVASGAQDTSIQNVTTVTNGGGDVSDAGTNSYHHRLNHSAGPQTPPAVPASNTPLNNPFPFDCTVYVNGGTVSAVQVGGTTTGQINGMFRVPAGSSIRLTYTGAPTWTWFGD